MDLILDDPQQEKKILEPAGFWIRVASFIIDYIIIQVIIFMLALVSSSLWDRMPGGVLLGVIGIYVIYFAVLESSELQATVGKAIVGLKVYDSGMNRLSFANSLGRTFSKFLSFIILCIGFMMVGWDDKKQGLHDKIANTYVFYK